jgi:Niemann-Pick C1 protein
VLHFQIYGSWETNRVITFELLRNLALAMACVFVITLIMLVNIKLCLLVLLTVVLTLVDIFGILYFLGVKINTISSIGLIIVVGLCVDYASHIAHSFSVAEGSSSQERISVTLVSIGPAILNGGTSTFLALVVLGFSTSYSYNIMFKA